MYVDEYRKANVSTSLIVNTTVRKTFRSCQQNFCCLPVPPISSRPSFADDGREHASSTSPARSNRCLLPNTPLENDASTISPSEQSSELLQSRRIYGAPWHLASFFRAVIVSSAFFFISKTRHNLLSAHSNLSLIIQFPPATKKMTREKRKNTYEHTTTQQ